MKELDPVKHGGFRMQAEWTRQKGVLLSWPLNPETWKDRRDALEAAYARFAATISCFEDVFIFCRSPYQEHAQELLDRAGGRMSSVRFFDAPTNDAWCRDHGPICLKNSLNDSLLLDFQYNAWGQKFFPFDLDNAVPRRTAEFLNMPFVSVPFVCEGGALETNGAGDLLTTESVLLNPNRNGRIDRRDAEAVLCDALGVQQVLWLPSGLFCDDTDGHIDTLTRFFNEDSVLTCYTPKKSSVNYEILQTNFSILKKSRLSDGRRLNVEKLPLPDPIPPPCGWREETLPGSYANFLILNDAVLVPAYAQPERDAEAARIIADVFPDRKIVSLDCSDIILEGGALHCLSQNLY